MKLLDALFAKFLKLALRDSRITWYLLCVHALGITWLGWWYALVYAIYALYCFSFGVRYAEWYANLVIEDVLTREDK